MLPVCRLVLLAMVFVACVAEASIQRSALTDAELYRLLRPETPREEAGRLLMRIRAGAEAGNGWDSYLLGTLLRLGPAHPSQLAPRDLDGARGFMLACLQQRECPSMALAALAEIDAGHGRLLEALAWAQGYLHVERSISAHAAPTRPLARHYGDELVHLIARQLPRPHRAPAAAGALASVREDYGTTLDLMIATRLAHRGDPDTPRMLERARHPKMRQPVSGLRLYVVQTGAEDGPPTGIALIDALPGPEHAAVIETMVRSSRFAGTADAAVDLRHHVRPMMYLIRNAGIPDYQP